MRVVWKHLVYLLLDIFLDRYPSYHFTKMAPGESCLKVRREGKGKGSDVLGRQWRNFCEKTNKSKPGWIMSILENPPPHFQHIWKNVKKFWEYVKNCQNGNWMQDVFCVVFSVCCCQTNTKTEVGKKTIVGVSFYVFTFHIHIPL